MINLNGVACVSAKVCEAVGYSGSAGVILRTTNGGSSWVQQPVPPQVGSLSGIACPSASVCEAVGGYTNSYTFIARGVVLGTTNGGKIWRQQAIPPGTKDLNSVTCPTVKDCLAAGFGFNDYNLVDYGVVLGTTSGGGGWEADTLPVSPVSVSEAETVACPSSTQCYLGGNGTTGTKAGSVIFGSDDFGATWSAGKVPPALARDSSTVTGLSCASAASCEAVTDSGSALGTTDGTTWATQAVPHAVSSLAGVTCRPGGPCWAAGNTKSGQGAILTKAATGAWAAQNIPTGVGPLAAVTCVSATTCEAAGVNTQAASRAATVGTVNGGKTWTAQRVFTGVSLLAAACGSASACEAVGSTGTAAAILGSRNGGRTWVRQPVPASVVPETTLTHVVCPSAAVCEAVGAGPLGPAALGTSNGGSTWVDQTKRLPSGTGTFAALSCPSASVCEAGGSQAGLGFIIRTADGGKSWTFQFLNFQATAVNAISCLSTTVCTALGQNGSKTIVLKTSNAGKTWQAHTISALPFPTGIACATATACEATGFRFSTPRQGDVAVILGTRNGWKTSARQPLPSSTTELFDVACPSASRCEAVGNAGRAGGVVLGTSNGGITWSAQTVLPVVNTLAGVSCQSASACTAAGLGAASGGIVLTGRPRE